MTAEKDPGRGARITHLRESFDFSKAELGRRVHVSERRVYSWEKGEPISRGNLRLLADELSTTPDFIEEGVDPVTSFDVRLEKVEGGLSRVEGDLTRFAADLSSLTRAVEDLASRTPAATRSSAVAQRPAANGPASDS